MGHEHVPASDRKIGFVVALRDSEPCLGLFNAGLRHAQLGLVLQGHSLKIRKGRGEHRFARACQGSNGASVRDSTAR